MYDAGLRVSRVGRLPGADSPGRGSDALVGLVDLAPTLLESPEDAELRADLKSRLYAFQARTVDPWTLKGERE